MEMQNKQEYEVVAGQVVTAQPLTANNNNVYGTPVIIPTVNTAGVQYGQPYAAQPYAPYPQQGNIVMNPYNGNQTSYATPANTQRMQRPTQRWLDNICDWPKNIFPSCSKDVKNISSNIIVFVDCVEVVLAVETVE